MRIFAEAFDVAGRRDAARVRFAESDFGHVGDAVDVEWNFSFRRAFEPAPTFERATLKQRARHRAAREQRDDRPTRCDLHRTQNRFLVRPANLRMRVVSPTAKRAVAKERTHVTHTRRNLRDVFDRRRLFSALTSRRKTNRKRDDRERAGPHAPTLHRRIERCPYAHHVREISSC